MERAELKKRILTELKYLEDIRRPTEENRGIAASLVYPRRKQFEGSAVAKRFTSKGTEALNIAVLGLMGNMISTSVDWFALDLDTDDDIDQIYGVKDWLESLRKKMKKEFEDFGLYQEVMLGLSDACAQGTSAILMLDDAGVDKVRYKVVEPEKFYIHDDEYGRVDKFYRVLTMSATDALDFFGDKNCPTISNKFKEEPFGEHEFIHAIFKRQDRDPFSLKVDNKKIASIYYSYTEDEVVRESGYDDMPVIVHRWVKDSESPYGGCPTFDCLESLKIYNKAWNNMLKQQDLATNPPMLAQSSMRGRFSIRPGAVNYVDNVTADITKPLYSGSKYEVMKDALETIIQEIGAAFHTDYFKMLVNREKQMTAREVIEVLGERASILVPVVERLQREVLTPIVKRHFSIMKTAHRIPEPPSQLAKKDIKLDVVIQGPLSQAMKKYHEAEGIMRALEIAIPIVDRFPGAEDNINTDELIRTAMDTAGMPARIIHEIDDRDGIREAKMAAMEQQRQQQAQAAEAEAYAKMKDAPQGGSPMQKLMQNSQGAALGAQRPGVA